MGGGWYRIWISGNLPDLTTDLEIWTLNSAADGSALEEDTNSVWWWGIMVEDGKAAPTTYIPTTDGTVTRNIDASTVTSLTTEVNNGYGTMFVKYRTHAGDAVANSGILSINDASSSDVIEMRMDAGVDHNTVITDVTSGTVDITDNTNIAELTTTKFATSWTVDNIANYTDGAAGGTDTTATIPTNLLVQLQFAAIGGGTTTGNIQIAVGAVWNRKRTTAFLDTITT